LANTYFGGAVKKQLKSPRRVHQRERKTGLAATIPLQSNKKNNQQQRRFSEKLVNLSRQSAFESKLTSKYGPEQQEN
jgi:hypothetical protein